MGNPELLKTGCWMLMRRHDDDKVCIGEFVRAFGRAPEHVIPENWWKFVGPIYVDEVMIRRKDHRFAGLATVNPTEKVE